MKITIKKEVFQKFHPKIRIAFILATNVNNNKLKESKLLLKETAEMNRLLFHPQKVKTHTLISPWALLQEKFGKQARHYHTSLEKLLRKAIKKRSLNTPQTPLNLINYLSLKHLTPIALDDFNKLTSPLTFQLSTGKERVSPLRSLKPRALFYQDKNHILGTKLEYWKSSQTKPSKRTTSYLIHLEALPPITNQKLKKITQETANLLKTFCGAKTKTLILSKNKNTTTI